MNTMDKELKIMFLLKVLLLICLGIFFFVFITSVKTNCQACSFEIDNKLISVEEFFQLYHGKCLTNFRSLPLNLSIDLPKNS